MRPGGDPHFLRVFGAEVSRRVSSHHRQMVGPVGSGRSVCCCRRVGPSVVSYTQLPDYLTFSRSRLRPWLAAVRAEFNAAISPGPASGSASRSAFVVASGFLPAQQIRPGLDVFTPMLGTRPGRGHHRLGRSGSPPHKHPPPNSHCFRPSATNRRWARTPNSLWATNGSRCVPDDSRCVPVEWPADPATRTARSPRPRRRSPRRPHPRRAAPVGGADESHVWLVTFQAPNLNSRPGAKCCHADRQCANDARYATVILHSVRPDE